MVLQQSELSAVDRFLKTSLQPEPGYITAENVTQVIFAVPVTIAEDVANAVNVQAANANASGYLELSRMLSIGPILDSSCSLSLAQLLKLRQCGLLGQTITYAE